MDHHKVLDIGSSPNPNLMDFTAGGSIGPDTGSFADINLTLQLGCFVDKRRFIQGDVVAYVGHGMVLCW